MSVTGLLVVSTQRLLGQLVIVLHDTPPHHAGRRRRKPAAVLTGVPTDPRGRELLRVRISFSCHSLKLNKVAMIW